jgi:D-proline reductase (dithiol) PrdB
MVDAAKLTSWSASYESWKEKALPKLSSGETKQAFADYPWFETEANPFARLAKPASETRFGLITTGGYSIAGEQEPMKPHPNFGGHVPEIREIPLDVDPARLEINHPGYDHRFAKEDINVNLPHDRLRELADAGEIGSVTANSLVLMGLIVDAAPLIEKTIPDLVGRLRNEGAEAALLVPS